jgi:protein AATF/BFR2
MIFIELSNINSCFRFSESKDVFKGVKRKSENEGSSSIFKRSKLSDYADKIEDNFEAYKLFRNGVLQKWHDRTKNLKDSRNPAMNLSIINKIDNALLGKNEMIRKTQIYRGDFELFSPIEKDPQEDVIILPEMFDDSEFYHQLLRELIEFKSNIGDNHSEITQKFIELQKVRNKMKRKIEKRASKGRMIRYNVHNKLVNFMPPKDTSRGMTDEAKNELFNSLFGNLNNTHAS